ncbi:hypothetical protein [Actinobacillus suis]|uniref:Uncharacterized protein n=2 Tax=Actinobacillus suis TaxID=716 RepID=K0G6G1_ACTSU|nr:hypothetical protein [Actinobacillus suis]AFU19304.1 hypothetical protein ASU2_05830 [Actinobacillus suis H91-0380]AIJ31443.1 hypothetical protein ASU1_05900 [Actinobacillus suis ATCC 33415]MCO4166562.1 hypothetical protein [Actinobacillus suis]MCO4168175.1 hypothetical protein [Actinobacillus suis]MCQ9629598.1 hypothetical protein [Actinobacillus suis]
MKKLMNKTFLTGLVCLFVNAPVLADDNALFNRYEQAKLRIAYEGQAGELLQQLAQRLKVGFITYELDTTRSVSIPNNGEVTIKSLTQQLESQLPNTDIRFEKIGSRLFLVASNKGGEPLVAQKQSTEQFIGEAIFSSDEESAPVTVTTAATAQTNNTSAQTSESAQKLQSIIDIVTNKEAIAKSKNKTPQYQVAGKEKLGLQNIRVTPLGTFLVFADNVNVKALRVTGRFEDIAQHDNLIAIVHKERASPAEIEVTDKNGKKLLLKKSIVKSK